MIKYPYYLDSEYANNTKPQVYVYPGLRHHRDGKSTPRYDIIDYIKHPGFDVGLIDEIRKLPRF